MKKSIAVLFIWYLFFLSSSGQSGFSIGPEIQVYPTGSIPGIRIEKQIKETWHGHIRVGYNVVRHRDLGVQDDERGGGFGFSLGVKKYLVSPGESWFLGPRADLWFNEVDWEDRDAEGLVLDEGTTKVKVFQPTLEGGYTFQLSDSKIYLSPAIAFGVEINIDTDGAPVGQGMILLGGLAISYRF